MMKYWQALLLLVALVASAAAWAVEPDEMLSNPRLEARARAISKELRCMVCQNESIDESKAPLAHDLRVLVRERLKAGDTDQEVVDFLVSRYGEFVLLKPPLSWHTAALWGAGPALLFAGVLMIVIVERRRRSAAPAGGPAKLTAAEEARVAAIMASERDPVGG